MRAVLRLAAYRRLLVANTLNWLAFQIGSVALTILVYRHTHSAIASASFFICTQFVPALIAPQFVARVEHLSVRRVLVTLYGLEAGVSVALAVTARHFTLPGILALALADGVLAATSAPIVRATGVAVTAPAGLLREANGLLSSSGSITLMVGPAVGGAIVAASSVSIALVACAGLFGAIAASLLTARGLPEQQPDQQRGQERLRATLTYVAGERVLRRLLALETATALFASLTLPVEIVFTSRSLHAGASGYGALLAVWGAGAIAGSVVYARLRRLESRTLLALAVGGLGVGIAVIAAAPVIGVAIGGAGVAGVGNGLFVPAAWTAIQEQVAEPFMTLVTSLNESLIRISPGPGILLGGAIAALFGARVAIALAAAASLAVTAATWLLLAPSAGRVGIEEDSADEPARSTTS